jgi:phage shock protein E
MTWIALLVAGVAGGSLLLRRAIKIPVRTARELLDQGALLVDVRTEPEFERAHLPSAVNLPLTEIAIDLPKRIPDRNQPILLHCQVGMRSGIARKKLRALGYKKAFSIGGYERAARILATEKN